MTRALHIAYDGAGVDPRRELGDQLAIKLRRPAREESGA